MADTKEDDGSGDLISGARKAFKRCADAENDNRQTGLEDIRFARLEEQWPDEVVQQRMIDHRPMLVINKLPAFIRQVVNDSRQNKPSITVHPVDSKADPKTAEVLSGIIRNIEAVSNADVAYDTGAEQAVTSGFGYWRVSLGYSYDDSFDLDILIERITNQFSVYGDPNSTAADSSDWDVCFVTDRIPKTEFKRKYGDKANTNFDDDAWSTAGSDWQDEDTVIIAEWWRRYEVEREIVMLDDGRVFDAEDLASNEDLQVALENDQVKIEKKRTIKSRRVTQTLISGCDTLKEEEDFPGCYIPIVPVYGDEIIVEGKRYFRSLIHSAKDAQRMFNYWRSTATELVALAPRVPWVGPPEAFEDDERWATANTRSHSYLTYGGSVAPQRVPLDSGPAGGAMQEALNASDDIKSIIGIYDASLGARSNETSGRAILARQREGDVSTFHFVDNVARAIRHTGKIVIGLIPKVYSGERIMRVLGEDGEAKNIPVNQPYQVDQDGNPVPQGQDQAQMQGPGGPMDQGAPPEAPEGQGEDAAEMAQIYTALHDLSLGKYDVTVTSGPSYTTRRVEAATEQMQFLQAFPAAAPVIGDIVAGNLDWPGADEIAKRLAKLNGQSEQQLPPKIEQQIEQGKQLIQQLQAENEQLKAGQAEKQAQAALDAQKIQVDAQKVEVEKMKAETAKFEADTARMETEVNVARAHQMRAAGLPIQ